MADGTLAIISYSPKSGIADEGDGNKEEGADTNGKNKLGGEGEKCGGNTTSVGYGVSGYAPGLRVNNILGRETHMAPDAYPLSTCESGHLKLPPDLSCIW